MHGVFYTSVVHPVTLLVGDEEQGETYIFIIIVILIHTKLLLLNQHGNKEQIYLTYEYLFCAGILRFTIFQ